MEATEGRETTGLFDKILPPRLEDCAQEAFLKAASVVKSCAATFFHADDEDEVEHGCVDDRFPDKGKFSSDILISPPCPNMPDAVLVGGGSPDPTSDAVDGCVKEKGCGEAVGEVKDVVIVGGDDGEAMVGKDCLDDELKDLEIKDKEKKKSEKQDDDERENVTPKPRPMRKNRRKELH